MKSLEFINQIDEILLRVSQITDIKDISIYPELLLNIRPCNRIAHQCKPVIRSIVIYVDLIRSDFNSVRQFTYIRICKLSEKHLFPILAIHIILYKIMHV